MAHLNRLAARIQHLRDRLLGRYQPTHMNITFHGTPTQVRAFLDSFQMHAQHLHQDGHRIHVTAKDYPMTECQAGLHQPTDGQDEQGRAAVVCAKCARTLTPTGATR